MQRKIRLVLIRAAGIGAVSLSVLLSGCGVNLSLPSSDYSNGVTLQGAVLAGRNYMAGATVKIYETQSNGVATNGSYVGKAKLLSTVTANTIGTWSASGISCESPHMLYVTAEGGTPYPSGLSKTTLSDNPNSLMMTAIGDCSLLSDTDAEGTLKTTSIITNEASTVAAVWTLKNFISLDGTTVNVTSSSTNYAGTDGVGVVGNYAGLAHAFLDAKSLAPYKKGAFQQYTNEGKAVTTSGVIPVQVLNGLAYAQYLCTIGGTGGAGDYSYCSSLYSLATTPSGSVPTNSLAAMLNIAKYPTNNAAALLSFTLTPIPYTTQTGSQQANAGVFVPAITSFGSYPANWTVAVTYMPTYGVTATGQGLAYPIYMTMDANDSVYVSNPSAATSVSGNVIAIDNTGKNLWTATTDTAYPQYNGIASDAFGNIWVANYNATALSSSVIQQFDAATGGQLNTFASNSLSLVNVAADPLGNVWYGADSTTAANVHELLKSSSYAENSFPVSLLSTTTTPRQIRVDVNGNVWIAGYSTSTAQVLYVPNSGTALAPVYSSGIVSLTLPSGTTMNGITTGNDGDAYVFTAGASGSLYHITVSGSGSSSVLTATSIAPTSTIANGVADLDIDGAGIIWYADSKYGTYLNNINPSTGTVTTYYPCYYASTTSGTGSSTSTVQTCGYSASSRWDMILDSTGSLWIGSWGNSGGGRVLKVIGVGAPTVPLHSLGKSGVMP